jgi:hypothetical protein
VQVAAADGLVERTLPGALEAEIARLAQIASVQETRSVATGAVQFLRATQVEIHQNIQAIVPLLSGGQRNSTRAATRVEHRGPQPASQAVARLAAASESEEGEESTFRADGGLALLRIHGIVKQLAVELGAPVEAEFNRFGQA